jgi:chemotaxis protein methyltransferase CheR
MTATKEEDLNFKKILSYLLEAKGFDGRQYKPNYIKRRVAVRMRATASSSYRDYFQVLQEDAKEPSRLLDRLTIHVTEFFRDPTIYQALQDKILPELSSLSGGNLKVWSAGCSTGEEPYSLAILFQEWASAHPGRSFKILATDIDASTVKTAEKGEYPAESIHRLPKARAVRWFRSVGSHVLVSQELKHFIRFRAHDLMGDWTRELAGFHLIFCRNLLIYLTAPQQQKVYERFAEALVPEGYLFLGLTETLLGPSRRFYRCVDVKHRIYQTLPKAAQVPAAETEA